MIAVIGVTTEQLREIVYDAMRRSRVDDDAPRSIMVLPGKDPSAAFVHCEFDVSEMAQPEWMKRISVMLEILKEKKFHVEHTTAYNWQRDLWLHRITVRHEYPRSV